MPPAASGLLVLSSALALAWSPPPLLPPPVQRHIAVCAAPPRAASPFLQSFDDDDEEEGRAAEVQLVEPASGRILPCFMAASLEWEGEVFAALYPVDAPVSLATMQNERLVPLDEELETDAMIDAAEKACAASDIELLRTPVVLTAKGPGLELVDGDAEALEYAEDGEDDETEEALLLAEFYHDGVEVIVVQTLDPLYVVGKKVDDQSFAVPTDNEIDAVGDTIEQLVAEFEEGFAEDDAEFGDDEFDV